MANLRAIALLSLLLPIIAILLFDTRSDTDAPIVAYWTDKPLVVAEVVRSPTPATPQPQCDCPLRTPTQASPATVAPIKPFEKTAVVTYPCISQWQQSGTTKQLRGAMEAFVVAVSRGLPWAPTDLANDHTTHCNIPFSSVINLTKIQDVYPNSVVEGTDSERHFTVTPCMSEDCFAGTETQQRVWKNVLIHLDIVDRLKEAVERVKPSNKKPYVCLHARVEKDFELFFQMSPRFKRPNEIVDMLMRYSMPSGLDTLYLAGGSTSSIRELIRNHPQNKFHTILAHENSAEVRSMTNLEKSLIDLFACQDAAIHVGTAGSIWSEWVHDYRHVRGLPTLMYAGDRHVHNLEPFVGANDRRFFGNQYSGGLEIMDAWVGNYGHKVRDDRITLAVERARRGNEIHIPADLRSFLGFDPMINAHKILTVTVRTGGSIHVFDCHEGTPKVWRP